MLFESPKNPHHFLRCRALWCWCKQITEEEPDIFTASIFWKHVWCSLSLLQIISNRQQAHDCMVLICCVLKKKTFFPQYVEVSNSKYNRPVWLKWWNIERKECFGYYHHSLKRQQIARNMYSICSEKSINLVKYLRERDCSVFKCLLIRAAGGIFIFLK